MITRLLEARSLENPQFQLAEWDDWLDNPSGSGGRSDSGVRVNRRSALTYPAFWRGINLISRDTAKLPFKVWRRFPDGGKEPATDHPAFRLMNRKPNPEMKAFDFRQTIQAHALSVGNGYGFIDRGGSRQPIAIVPLDPEVTYPVRADGVLSYVTTVDVKGVSTMVKLDPRDVLHIKGLGFDGLVGYDVLSIAKQAIGTGLAAAKHVAIHFKKGTTASVVLTHPQKLTDETAKRLRTSWERLHAGLNAETRTAILEEGMKAEPLSIDHKKSQVLELRNFEVRQIANILGLPPHKLGDPARTSFASLEQENAAYLHDALDGWL